MANVNTYEVHIDFMFNADYDSTRKVECISFRDNLSLEQATDLARSLWLATDNSSIQVVVCKSGESIAQITFRSRE